jgi:Tol biopolymer transport system component
MVFILSVMLAATASAAHGTAPGRNGRIAYMRKDANGHWQVWAASARLTAAKRLTGDAADSGWPVWSPAGSELAFDSSRADPDSADSKQINDIFVMNPDGSGVKKLTDSKGASANAAWSPDGSLIAFDADRGDYPQEQGIYVMDNNGGNLRRITTLPANAANDLAPRSRQTGLGSYSHATAARAAPRKPLCTRYASTEATSTS